MYVYTYVSVAQHFFPSAAAGGLARAAPVWTFRRTTLGVSVNPNPDVVNFEGG